MSLIIFAFLLCFKYLFMYSEIQRLTLLLCNLPLKPIPHFLKPVVPPTSAVSFFLLWPRSIEIIFLTKCIETDQIRGDIMDGMYGTYWEVKCLHKVRG